MIKSSSDYFLSHKCPRNGDSGENRTLLRYLQSKQYFNFWWSMKDVKSHLHNRVLDLASRDLFSAKASKTDAMPLVQEVVPP